MVCAAGGLPGDLHKLWQAGAPLGYHMEYGYSCMGYEIAGGLGVKLAHPGREVIVVVGDGSYLMMNSEIATSVMLGLKLIIVVTDNRGFACINRLQRATGGRVLQQSAARRASRGSARGRFCRARELARRAGGQGRLDRRTGIRARGRAGGHDDSSHRPRHRSDKYDGRGRRLVERRGARDLDEARSQPSASQIRGSAGVPARGRLKR